MEISIATVAMAAGTFVLGGLVKGVIGLGLPSIAIGLLAALMSPAKAAALMIVPSLVTNVWQAFTGAHLLTLLRRIGALLATSALGVFIGGGVLTGSNSRLAALGLGLALVAYALLGLTAVRFVVARRSEFWLSPLVGLATGVVAGATGVFVVPAVPYLQAIGLDKDELVQALGLSFTISTVTLAAVLWRDGVLHWESGMTSALAVLPAFAGMVLGQEVRKRVSPAWFRRCFFGGLLLLGLQQALRNLL